MCYCLFIAANNPLPLIQWDENNPKFHIEEADPEDPECRQFSKPHIYYFGSHSRCGCGFLYENAEYLYKRLHAKEEYGYPHEKVLETMHSAFEYIRQALEENDELELFLVGPGGRDAPPERRISISVSELRGEGFPFDEDHQLVVIRR